MGCASSICARDTRLAGSVLDRERTVNLSISSSVIVNSITRRHPAMIPLLVLPIAKQGIRHQIISSTTQVSWNRSSSFCAIASGVHGCLAKYRAAASTQVLNTSSASRPRALPSVGRKTGYPPLWTAPTIMRLSGRWKPSMPRSACFAPSCLRMRDSKSWRVRITKDRLAFPEKPADLDQRAGIGGCACERREVGNDDVAFPHHRYVLFVNRLPDLQLRSGCLGIFVERRQ